MNAGSPRCVVFTGPSLPAAEVARRLPCAVLPPVRQGDLWRAVRRWRPVAVGLIDGAFLDAAAVWHREILWALAQGVHVFGAASMGALRAAELDGFGMRGIGLIYAAYRDGTWPGCDEAFEDDDEVAVIHAPAELGAAPLSDAMVDIRATLLRAEAEGVIGGAAREALTAAMKRLYFAERSFARLEAEAAAALPGGGGAFRAWLRTGRVACKRSDAEAMLDAMSALLRDGPAPFRAGFRMEPVLVWTRFVAAADDPGGPDDETALVLEELRLDPASWRDAVRAGLGRLRALEVRPGLPDDPPLDASPDAAWRELDALRRRHGLATRAALDAWMAENALDRPALERLLREEAALNAASADMPPGLTAAVAAELRRSGAFAPLLRRARRKRAALDGMPPRPPSPAALGAALAWYAEARAEAALDGPQSRNLAWLGREEFEAAVWREYLFASRAVARREGGQG